MYTRLIKYLIFNDSVDLLKPRLQEFFGFKIDGLHIYQVGSPIKFILVASGVDSLVIRVVDSENNVSSLDLSNRDVYLCSELSGVDDEVLILRFRDRHEVFTGMPYPVTLEVKYDTERGFIYEKGD